MVGVNPQLNPLKVRTYPTTIQHVKVKKTDTNMHRHEAFIDQIDII